MKYFKYKAVTSSGDVVRGMAEAVSALEMNRNLSMRGLTMVSYRPAVFARYHRKPKWSRKDLINFIFHLEQMLAAGIPMLEALTEFGYSADRKRQSSVVEALVKKIDGGQSLSNACSAMPETFSPLVLSMLEAGEQSGKLEQTLRELGDLLKWQDESISRLRRVMIYPAFVAVVLLAAILLFMTWLVPGMVAFIGTAGATLPWHTRALIVTSEVVSDYWVFAAIAMIVVTIALRMLALVSRRTQLGLDRIKLRIPLIGPVIYKTRLARFSRCASMMYGAGINIIEALRFSKGTLENRMMEAAIEGVGRRLIDGQGISNSFDEVKVFPPLVARILRVGESTGALDVSFDQLSYVYDRESKELTEKLEQSLGPIMTVIVGVIMMWVVVSVIGPIYDLVFGISGGQL